MPRPALGVRFRAMFWARRACSGPTMVPGGCLGVWGRPRAPVTVFSTPVPGCKSRFGGGCCHCAAVKPLEGVGT